jgi:hypothetical protein
MLLSIDRLFWEDVVKHNKSPMYLSLLDKANKIVAEDSKNAIKRLIDMYMKYLAGLALQFIKFCDIYGRVTMQDISYGIYEEPGPKETFIHGIINHYVLYNNIVYFMFRSIFLKVFGIDECGMLPQLVEETLRQSMLPRNTKTVNDYTYYPEWSQLNEDMLYYYAIL